MLLLLFFVVIGGGGSVLVLVLSKIRFYVGFVFKLQLSFNFLWYKVFNLNFHEVFSVISDMNSVLCMVFNSVTDELITGGTGGIKVSF
jgi:hypothetical protein